MATSSFEVPMWSPLHTLRERLASGFGTVSIAAAADEWFSACTMQEEREVAGLRRHEATAGEVELF